MERRTYSFPHLPRSAGWTEQEKWGTWPEETLTKYRCFLEEASKAAVLLKHQPTLA